MWLFTKYGFFSAVSTIKGRDIIDPDRIVVRARCYEHLENLKRRFKLRCHILGKKGTDYAYRILIGKKRWAEVCKELAEETDYTNFKNEVRAVDGPGPYESLCHQVWSVMLRLQRLEETEDSI